MRKPIVSALFTFLFFLVQTCVIYYLPVMGVYGNVLFAWLAITTVSLGKKYTFWFSMVYGILFDATLNSLSALYLVAYPIIATLMSLLFADMSEKKREQRRASAKKKKRTEDHPAPLRILLCAMCQDVLWHFVMLCYAYLNGAQSIFRLALRAVPGIVCTTALALVLMYPCRLALGLYTKRRRLMRSLPQ